MLRNIVITAAIITATALRSVAADNAPFVSHAAPSKFIDLDIHAMIGGSTVTQNYSDCFSAISEINLSMGTAFGIGATARFSFTNFIGMGVEANFMINNYRMSLAVADDDATSITNCFVRNHYYTANFPVYISLNFNLGSVVRWNIDAGLYYTYGLSGRSKSTLYNARVNELGQLITSVTNQKASYYNSPDAFIASSYRGDIGLHIATGFTFMRRYSVGVRSQIGFKNESHAYNAIKQPNVHNINLLCSLGYHF